MISEPVPVDTIVVRQDVGGPYPDFKYVALDLYEDGSVRWRKPDPDDFSTPEAYVRATM